jgi:hypothetical protein
MIMQGARVISSALSNMADTLESDLKRIFTPSAVAAVLTLGKGLWQAELQGHTHTLCPSFEDNEWRWRRELARFLVNSSEPMITLPQLPGDVQPQRVTRDVYKGAAHLHNLLQIIMHSDDLLEVVPDEISLLQGGRMRPSSAHPPCMLPLTLATCPP